LLPHAQRSLPVIFPDTPQRFATIQPP
jgi:hypothetical protein